MAERSRRRRSYSKAFKRRVVSETLEPGASVSAIAQHHGLNANMVFLWRRDPRFGPGRDAAVFLPVDVTPVTVSPEPVATPNDGRVEITLAAGHRVVVSGAFDPDLVVRLVRGLAL